MIAFAPLLDPDWDDAEAWLIAVTERRRPQMIATPDFYTNHVSSFAHSWEDAERLSRNANRIHSAYLTDEIIAERAARRELLKQAVIEETALGAAKRQEAMIREEQKRAARRAEAAEALAQRQAWNDERFTDERRRILAESWGCAECKGPAVVFPYGDQYKLVCYQCPREAIVDHTRVMQVINAPRIPAELIGLRGIK